MKQERLSTLIGSKPGPDGLYEACKNYNNLFQTFPYFEKIII